MKTKLIVTASLLAWCASAIAETFPIIDVQRGYLIGAIENGKWIESDNATKSVKKGAKLQVYGVSGSVGNVTVVKLDTQEEACPDRPMVKLNPKKMKQGEIAFAAKWNPLPRKPKSLEVKDKNNVDLVREFLRERGLKDPVIHVTHAVQIDLDGDGQDEIVISATHYKDGEEIPDEATPNTYSFVMMARSVNGKMETKLVAGEFYPGEAKGDMPPNKFEIAALLDLNGDGKIDIVVRSAYYEGDETSVYEYSGAGFKTALSVGCGL
jgi:hypothetical protein